LAEGHPFIDRYAQETCDVVRHDGHTYASKGLALDRLLVGSKPESA
jgi:hypothetical protein